MRMDARPWPDCARDGHAAAHERSDKDNWHTDILSDEIAAKWREEVFPENNNIPKESMRQISARAWDWCLAELRHKASRFEETQFVRLMDAGAAACKSDTLVSESLRVAL